MNFNPAELEVLRKALSLEMAASLVEGSKEHQSIATRLFMQFARMQVKPEVVTITIEEGLLDVTTPPGIEVHVYDYDVEGVDDDELSKDEHGFPCIISEYGK
jgi:hypothetical protein